MNQELFPWLRTLYPIWSRLTEPMLHVASLTALSELLLSGCTTASDHHYLFNDALTEAVDVQIAAAEQLGMRVVLGRGSMNLRDDDVGFPSPNVVEPEAAIIDHTEALLRRHHDPEPGAMVQIAVAPNCPMEVTQSLMRESARLARRYRAPLHTHLAETQDEVDFCLQHFGCRTVDYLESVDWLANDVWVAHGIHFDNAEIERLGAAGVGICHCPSSNAVLGSGVAPLPELERAGCPVGLGVDGSASNDGSNLMQELRQAFLTQRMRHGTGVRHQDALRWATAGGADCLGRPELGRLAAGACADIAMYTLDDIRFWGSDDPLAALVLCGAHRADRVMVNGRWAVENGAIVGLDMAQLRARHAAASGELRQRVAL
ncbi:amidohydrolase family protein [Alkalilimnicola ehrlichii]|uniref:amidohydrolase family protein n=1 Tax=Alkalilimnicola ehrlichii TaxID=351052 RepID=UPI001C6E32EC|nr:amidohydrolase family protein [Alkalilimnicola ehrlichii]